MEDSVKPGWDPNQSPSEVVGAQTEKLRKVPGWVRGKNDVPCRMAGANIMGRRGKQGSGKSSSRSSSSTPLRTLLDRRGQWGDSRQDRKRFAFRRRQVGAERRYKVLGGKIQRQEEREHWCKRDGNRPSPEMISRSVPWWKRRDEGPSEASQT